MESARVEFVSCVHTGGTKYADEDGAKPTLGLPIRTIRMECFMMRSPYKGDTRVVGLVSRTNSVVAQLALLCHGLWRLRWSTGIDQTACILYVSMQ